MTTLGIRQLQFIVVAIAIATVPCVAPAKDGDRQATDVVFMGKGLVVKGTAPRCHQPASLTRELLRQSFLVAAREELGLATRDAWLGSEIPVTKESAAGNLPFDVAFTISPDNYEARIVRGTSRQPQTLKDTTFTLEQDANYLGLLEQAEEASRTRFVAAIEEAGFSKQPAEAGDNDDMERSLEALEHLDVVPVFAAIRQLHAMRGSAGVDEQARLGGLARGYALLGLLTEHCWDPLSKAFKARGLVYAQRMAARAPDSPLGWWHRAYVLSLTGLNAAALDDLARAEKLAAGNDSPPPWVSTINAFCRMDIAALQAARPDGGALSELLEVIALDQAGCGPQVTEAGLRLLKQEPRCLWLMDAIYRQGYIGACHVVTAAAGHAVANLLVPDAARLDGIPTGAKPKRRTARRGLEETAKQPHAVEFDPVATMIAALLDRGRLDADGRSDEGEPRWETLGLMLRELTWMAVFDRGKFERLQYGVPADEWLSVAGPIISLHPYGDTVLLYSSDPAVRAKATEKTLGYRPDVLEYSMAPFFDRTIPFDEKRRSTLSRVAARFVDDTAGELSRLLRYTSADGESLDYWLTRLRQVSPHSPMISLILIKKNLPVQPGDDASLKRQAEQFATVGAALGARHLDRQEFGEAESLLERAAKLSRDGRTYMLWADAYERQGNDRRWLEVLEAALEEPDFGLQHADVRCRIASKFLYGAKPEQALPYAEQAARTYHGVGIDLFAQCHEALRKWERAETILKVGAERYPGTVGWYAFCRRTGKGDAKAAQAQLRSVLQEGHLDRLRAAEAEYELARLDGDADGMKRALQNFPTVAAHPTTQLMILLCEQPPAQNEELAKQLDTVITAAKKGDGPGVGGPRPELVAFAEALKACGLDREGRIDAASLRPLAAKIDSRKRCSLQFLLGLILEREGRDEEAVAEWKECMKLSDINYSMRTLAGAKLVAHGVSADDVPAIEPIAGE